MDEKRKIKTAILLIVGFIILVYGLTVTYRYQTRSILQENLDKSLQQYRDGIITEIDFATLTPFPWDKLYVFGPYQPCSGVIKTLKIPLFWPTCILGASPTEHEALYVFTHHELISQYLVAYPFPIHGGITEFTIEEARFTLGEHGKLVVLDEE